MKRHTWIAAALALVAAPALAQDPPAAQPAGHADMMKHMICEMGVLPSFEMHAMMGRMSEMPGMQGMQHAQPPAGQAMQHQGMQHAKPPAGAQGMKQGAEGAGMPDMMAMMGEMDHSRTAFMLAEHGEEMGLALTDEQKTKLNQLAEQASAACATHLQAAHDAHAAALTALDKGDVDEYGEQLEEAAEHAVEAHVPVIRSGIEGKALLTDAQRAKLPAKGQQPQP